MSGFAATFSRAPDPEIGTRADRMSARLLHRGAVETVAGQDEQVAVRVHNRERGVYRATASVDAESVVIFDGALLDEDALLAELGAAGVAEAAGEGLRRHGAAWLSRLDGSFAIVVLDRRTGTVSLIRDRFGHRPLAAAVLPDRVLVASEVKCFLPDSSLRRAVDEDGLASALSLGLVLGPETLLQHVYKALPGRVCEVRDGTFRVRSGFVAARSGVDAGRTLADVESFAERSLDRTLRAYGRGEGRIGVLLSGGIDSALLASLLAEVESTEPLAVSFGAEDWARDESATAGTIARSVGLPFIAARVDGDLDVTACLRSAVWHIEEPTRFDNAVALEVACRAATDRADGLLTGESGDLLFGETAHVVARWLPELWRLPHSTRRSIASSLRRLGVPPAPRLGRYVASDSIGHYVWGGQRWAPVLRARAPTPSLRERLAAMEASYEHLSSVGSFTLLTLLGVWYPWIERMEQTAAAHGIDALHPFQRNELLDFALATPYRLKVRRCGLDIKPALRNLVRRRLGHEAASRRKQQLAVPFEVWLEESARLRSAVLALRGADCRHREFVDRRGAELVLDDFERNGTANPNTRRAVSMLLNLEIWLGQFLDDEAPAGVETPRRGVT